MVEQQKKRLEDAISGMIEDMYRTHLRRMQVRLGSLVGYYELLVRMMSPSPQCTAVLPVAARMSEGRWRACRTASRSAPGH